MLAKHWTVVFIIAAVVLLIGWDIVVITNDVPGDTISEITLGWAKAHPVVPFLFGVLMGHLFWPQRPLK